MRTRSMLWGGMWLLVAGLPALVASGPHDRAQAPGSCTESPCIPGLDSLTSTTLRRALDYLGVDGPELGFDKLYAEDDTFRLAAVERILGDPLGLPAFQQGLWDRIRSQADSVSSLPEVVQCLGALIEAAEPQTSPGGIMRPGSTGARLVHPDSLSPFQDAADRFVRSCHTVQASLDAAFAGLTDQDKERILDAAPAFWGDPDDAEDAVRAGRLHREFGVTTSPVDDVGEDAVLDAATRLNRSALTAASRQFMESVVALWGDVQAAITTADSNSAETCRPIPGVDGRVLAVFDTPWGMLVIAGPGQNIYAVEAMREIAFLVDLGGDDVYHGRASSAVGGLLRSLAVLVDGGGDDLYDSGERDFCLGGAVLGVAALIDLEGDDVYRAGDGTMGAGFFGSGVLADWGGNDMFDGRNLCQGAGAFGIGVLIAGATGSPPPGPEVEEDRGFTLGLVKVPGTGARPVRHDENDIYLCARQSQGFASTFGAGLLYDGAGNDVYRAGGRYLHRPLLPDDFQSLSQGFSIGFRPRAGGGIGILVDEEGNDFYAAEVYAQGASYWYSLGLLFDGGGNDRYMATQYAQGAGIHLSVGSLWDRGGDDHYVCKFGVTQGTAHDLSVGMLLEEGGNDYYVVSDGQGMSITNSTAVFIDTQGNDVYATPGSGQGSLTWARGFCGGGVFLDLEGHDTYPRNADGGDSTVWSSDLYALGIDLPRDVTLPAETVPEPVLTAADSARPVEELFETASLWEVGSAREKVRRARATLLTKAEEALRYAVDNKLGTRDGLEYRTLEEIAKAIPESCASHILPRLHDSHRHVVGNVIALLGTMKRREARGPMEAMLKDDRQSLHWARLLQGLGSIGDGAAAPAVRPFLDDPGERRRIQAAVALAALNDSLAIPSLVDLLDDGILTVRSAASRALVAFGAAAVAPLASRVAARQPSSLPPTAVPGDAHCAVHLRTIGQIAVAIPDTADAASRQARGVARRALMQALDAFVGPFPAERAAAAEGLLRLADSETQAFVRLRMLDETDALVRGVFQRGLRDQRVGNASR